MEVALFELLHLLYYLVDNTEFVTYYAQFKTKFLYTLTFSQWFYFHGLIWVREK